MKRASLRLLVACVTALLTGTAAAQIVVVSGRNSAITALDKAHAEQLFLGRSRALPGGVPVTLADLPAGPVRDRFYEQLTGKNPSQTRAYWSRQVFTGRALPPREAASVTEVLGWLAENPTLIGYLPERDADARVRVLLRLP